MVSGFGKPSIRFNGPMEVSNRSGVATPGAIGVVILKVWAEADVTAFVTRAATARPRHRWLDDLISTAPGVREWN
jgi:hypothetical protein